MAETTKVIVHTCSEHDHVVVFVDGQKVIQNDYSVENMTRLCEFLGFEVEYKQHSSDEFEELFA